MGNSKPIPGIKDNGGRRLGIVERKFSQERRSGQDRRTRDDQGNASYARRSMDRHMEFVNTHKGVAYGLLFSLPIWALTILFLMGKL
jgi:hypothetical protein